MDVITVTPADLFDDVTALRHAAGNLQSEWGSHTHALRHEYYGDPAATFFGTWAQGMKSFHVEYQLAIANLEAYIVGGTNNCGGEGILREFAERLELSKQAYELAEDDIDCAMERLKGGRK
ncbi:MAG: hypothetical protein LBE83_00200 [Propionibacteriaceae bacterium]|nr:hypothetical protein [Propionibacteriaceae bacterium]